MVLGNGQLCRAHLVRRLSGMTGDTFGSINEVTQMTFWVLTALTVAVVS